MSKKHKFRLSKISALHYFKLFYRSALWIAATVTYIIGKLNDAPTLMHGLQRMPITLSVIWVIFVAEMVLRFFPSNAESMGCQKQFRKNYIPAQQDGQVPQRRTSRGVLAVAVCWILLNGTIGVLYDTGCIDAGILLLISLAYSVCDMICILFFCPFQTWFMKNKCCGSCRIYNWDYAMMFTPLVFIRSIYTWSLLGIALFLLLVWEISARLHPERFSECSNAALSCANCKEKLCHHKTQLRHFLKTNKDILLLKGNALIDKAKKRSEEDKS
ncbi:MAG: hypothetical protein IJW40_03715 [Clostridia bacterium]|nr:hypothetical protein [Clostridia bacterium]